MACPLCNDTGWRRVDRDGVRRVVRCQCWQHDFTKNLLSASRVPARYARCELDTFEHDMDSQREAFHRATAFIDAFPVVDRGLLLHGPHGVGKTHLAVGMLKEAIRRTGAHGYFFETRELLRLVRDTYNRSVEETEMDVLGPVLHADLLVLDDLGAERKSDWVLETLGLVVNTRYNAKRPTIFTSNLMESSDSTDVRSFSFQLGERTRSRLLEMCDWVEIQGVDVRDVGPRASADAVLKWQRESPASPQNVGTAGQLPDKAKSMARAKLKGPSPADLKWPGGRAGS